MLGLFFGFNGRINRSTYWFGNLIVGFIGFFGMMFGIMLAGTQGFDKTAAGALRLISTMGLTVGPVLFAMSWAGMALQVKRFHDRGRSGFFTLIPFVPVFLVVMAVVQGAMTNAPIEQIARDAGLYMNVLFLINFAFFIDLGCLGSKEGPNKYGDQPKTGFGMGQPSASAPSATKAAAAQARGPAVLGNVNSAMERAIAEQAARAKTAAPQPARAAPLPSPLPSMAPTVAPAGFGRRPAR